MGENTELEALANAQSQPGTFNLIERLQGRNLPTEDVAIYLDEKLGWDLLRLEEKHSKAKKSAEAEDLEKRIARVRKELEQSKYVFTVSGMTNERYDAIIDSVEESFPLEYEEETNVLTGQKVRTPIPNEDRESLFNTLFLAESLTQVSDPDGNVDADITPEKVEFIKNLAPLDGIRRLIDLATKMRMVVAWMDGIQDEDFSPAP